jgi:hypothetical protein
MARGLGATVCGLLVGLLVLCSPLRASRLSGALSASPALAPDMALTAMGVPEPPPPPEARGERADAAFSRGGPRSAVSGGLLTIPSTFSSEDGAYDLVVHFHGETSFVLESFAYAGFDGVVAVVNLGVGSARYEEQFAMPWALPQILDQTQDALEKRGLRGAKLRRVALSAFSAGCAAVRRVLDQPAVADRVDAVLLLDGLHIGYSPRDHDLDVERLAAVERFARKASLGQKLFLITHSEVVPGGDYASTQETTNKLLERLGVARAASREATAIPELASLRDRPMQRLVPRSRADAGDLHVRGYAGDQKDDHLMHLLQMSAIAIPDLVRHWSRRAAE